MRHCNPSLTTERGCAPNASSTGDTPAMPICCGPPVRLDSTCSRAPDASASCCSELSSVTLTARKNGWRASGGQGGRDRACEGWEGAPSVLVSRCKRSVRAAQTQLCSSRTAEAHFCQLTASWKGHRRWHCGLHSLIAPSSPPYRPGRWVPAKASCSRHHP